MAWSGFDGAVRLIPGGAAAVFHKLDVPLGIIDQPGMHVPLRKYLAFFELVSQLTGEENFGLRLGSRTRAERSGIPGHLVLSARHFRDALQGLAWSMPTLVGGLTIRLVEDRDPPAFVWSILSDAGPTTQFTSHANVYFVRMMQAHRGRAWRPLRVLSTVPRPTKPERHRAVLGCPIVFDAPINAIEIARADLRAERQGADPHLYTLLTSLARMLMAKTEHAEDSVEALVRFSIRDGLNIGRADLAFVASRLGLSPRAVQRALAEGGMSFAELRDSERFALARDLLRHSKTPVGEVAARLGYAETAAFSRAFRRHHGVSPRGLRRPAKPLEGEAEQ